MASCRSATRDEGYATPAALVLSLALALVGSAMIVRSVQTLQLSKAELERTRMAYALDGAHFTAAVAIVRSGEPGPYHWVFGTDMGDMDAVAEPEVDKLGPQAASELDDGVFQRLGVADPALLKTRLAQAAVDHAPATLGDLSDAPLWRDCGPSLISLYGQQNRFQYVARQAPKPGQDTTSWHVGEAWRVRIASATGWRDDRIVRFTGNARHPTAVVARRLTRGGVSGEKCEEFLSGVSSG